MSRKCSTTELRAYGGGKDTLPRVPEATEYTGFQAVSHLLPLTRARRGQTEFGLLQALDLIPQTRRFLELEVAGTAKHLSLELPDLPRDLLGAHRGDLAARGTRLCARSRPATRPRRWLRAPSMMSATPFSMPRGVMPCCALKASCFVRRRFVSSIARCIDPVTRSA